MTARVIQMRPDSFPDRFAEIAYDIEVAGSYAPELLAKELCQIVRAEREAAKRREEHRDFMIDERVAELQAENQTLKARIKDMEDALHDYKLGRPYGSRSGPA